MYYIEKKISKKDSYFAFHKSNINSQTYYGFDPSVIKDDLEKKAWETMVRTYGQTPRQLLKQPHPQYITNFQHAPDNIVSAVIYIFCDA